MFAHLFQRSSFFRSRTSSNMEKLTRENHLDIFSRLPTNDLLQIKLVCKAWHALVKDPRLLTMLRARASNRNPSLILQSDISSPRTEMLYISPEDGGSNHPHDYGQKVLKVVPPFISNMPEYEVVGSCNGLICISNALYLDPIYVCNIFTGDSVELPRSPSSIRQDDEQEVALGFGYHPAIKEYKIVRAVYYRTNQQDFFGTRGWNHLSEVQIFTVGTKKWRNLEPIDWRLSLRPSEAFLNGAIHWIVVRDAGTRDQSVLIVAFDLAEDQFEEIDCPTCDCRLNPFNFHLVDLSGCLSAVVRHEGTQRIEIWVMKEYKVMESWTRDYVITSNVPASLSSGDRQTSKIRRTKTLSKRYIGIEVVCMLKNGDILLNYDGLGLVLYSPHDGSFKELGFSGLPNWFSVITHVDTLFSVEDMLRM